MAIFDTIKLEKGMYSVSNKNFTKVLESLDPSENYKGTEFEGLDAFQRQLKRFDIKISGPNCDTVEKFFSTSDSSVLFPEYLARSVKQGLNSSEVLQSVTAANTSIDGIDYRAISSETVAGPGSVDEGTAMRNVNVKTKDNLVKLSKHGRVFSSTYEAIRFQNLDVLTVILKQIGADIANELLADAVQVLINGNATGEEAEEIFADYNPTPAIPTLAYAHLLQLLEALSPHKLNVMMASATTIKEILNLDEMKDPRFGLKFQDTGNVVTPLGAKLVLAPTVANHKILGLDKDCAVQMIQSGGVVIDHDRVIDRQLERAGISLTAGFSKIFNDSVKVLDYSV